jgi:hypothetical protein
MRSHCVGRRVFTSLAYLLQKEELGAAFVRRCVFTPLGDLRKLELVADKEGEKRNESKRTKVTICTKRQ